MATAVAIPPAQAGPSTSLPAQQAPSADQEAFEVQVEFGGGLTTLFSGQESLLIRLPPPHTLQHLISLLRPLSSPPEMFSSPGPGYELRPGVLAVVGGEDWEVREPGGMECLVGKGEEVVFISTLHGG